MPANRKKGRINRRLDAETKMLLFISRFLLQPLYLLPPRTSPATHPNRLLSYKKCQICISYCDAEDFDNRQEESPKFGWPNWLALFPCSASHRTDLSCTATPPPVISKERTSHAVLHTPQLLLLIFQHLPGRDCSASARVCREWSEVASDYLWNGLATLRNLLEIPSKLSITDSGWVGFANCVAVRPER